MGMGLTITRKLLDFYGATIAFVSPRQGFDTAVEMLNMAVANGGRVDSCDTNSLLEAAVKKGKVQAARNCIASMHALYHNVDGKFIDFVEKNSSPAQLTSGHSGGDDHSFATSIQRPAPSSVPPWRGMA